jgi:WD40 repeat protein
MVSGCGNDIKVWQFDKGKLSQLKKIKRHKDYISCLLFSKKMNWFVSSSKGTIISWKGSGNDWINAQP